MSTIKQAIEASLREIKVLAEAEEATADMIQSALQIFKDMLASWSVEGLMVPFSVIETFTLSSSTAAYEWGPSEAFNSVAPLSQDALRTVAFVISVVQKPLIRLSRETYAGMTATSLIGEPTGYFYEMQTTPILHLNCIPYGGSLRTNSFKPLDNTFELTDAMEFPDAYSRMIRTNLAIDLCPGYSKTASAELVKVSRDSKATIVRANLQPIPNMRHNIPLIGRRRSVASWFR